MYVLQKWITSPTDFWSHFSSPICLLGKPKKKELDITCKCRWWFQTFLACSPRKLGNDPIWLYIFFQIGWNHNESTADLDAVPLQVAIGQAGAIHPLIRLLEDHEQRVGNTQRLSDDLWRVFFSAPEKFFFFWEVGSYWPIVRSLGMICLLLVFFVKPSILFHCSLIHLDATCFWKLKW